MELKKFNVTVRRFDPNQDSESGEDFILPVDSPDEEHAAASTMSNLISFTPKTENGTVLPVAFRCVKIEERK